MMIGAVSNNYGIFPAYGAYGFGVPSTVDAAAQGASAVSTTPAVNGVSGEDAGKKVGRTSSPQECQTCKERKYQDGSNEMNVSFKSAAHVSPEAAGAAVRAHEGEHVQNAYNKARQGGGQVITASVAIHTAVCPECGRTYVSGGTTTTAIRYPNESNPYQQDRKSRDSLATSGANVDFAV